MLRMKIGKIRYCLCRLWVFLLILPLGTLSVFAGENSAVEPLDGSKRAALGITAVITDKSGDALPVQGMKIGLYRVAALSVREGSVVYTLTETFQDSGLRLSDMTASESLQAAEKLSSRVTQRGLQGVTADTDVQGRAEFKGLEQGMYLAVQQSEARAGGKRVYMAPCLWSVPAPEWNAEKQLNLWNYSVEVLPKLTERKPPKPPGGGGGGGNPPGGGENPPPKTPPTPPTSNTPPAPPEVPGRGVPGIFPNMVPKTGAEAAAMLGILMMLAGGGAFLLLLLAPKTKRKKK